MSRGSLLQAPLPLCRAVTFGPHPANSTAPVSFKFHVRHEHARHGLGVDASPRAFWLWMWLYVIDRFTNSTWNAAHNTYDTIHLTKYTALESPRIPLHSRLAAIRFL
jgi:hypothetical protein